MSMFDNVVFDEFTLLEGKQADEYRKRKESQARAEKNRHFANAQSRAARTVGNDIDKSVRPGVGTVKAVQKQMEKRQNDIDRIKTSPKGKKDTERYEKIINKSMDGKLSKKDYDFSKNYEADVNYAADAIRRHDRRHPKTESAFSDIEMI